MKKSLFIKLYILPCLLLSPLFTMSCNSWFSIWVSLEFNLLSFIPFLIFFNKYHKEISMKYFIIQTISSSIFIISSIFFISNFNTNFNSPNFINLLINLSLMMKLGSSPFHFWFINIMKNLNWMNCLILSTWQKIIPMIITSYLINFKLIYIFIILSSITGALFGLNHQSIRLILSYSSINHISWMLLNLLISQFMWMLYFFIYSLTNMSIMMILNKFKIFYINQIPFLNLKINNKIMLFMNFISISGLPPTLGFISKWMTLYFIMWFKFSTIIIIMIFMSIFTFIFYMRISISLFNKMTLNNKMLIINKFKLMNLNFYKMMFIYSFMNLWLISFWLL